MLSGLTGIAPSEVKMAVAARTGEINRSATDRWVKRDTDTGQFIDQKADDKAFKGVRKEE